MSAREFVALGTSSQTPTRYRAHSSYALRWDEQLIIFDPGEGTQRQCTLAGISITRATAVCVSHFHGDHCLGLPGVIQRRSLDNAYGQATSDQKGEPSPLPIFYPSDGQEYFDRLRHASIFHDQSGVVAQPVHGTGEQGNLGDHVLSAVALDHRVTTYGYRIQEPDGLRVDKQRLTALGIDGPDVGRLLHEGSIETPTGTVGRDQVTSVRRGQSMAFVMDTRMCEGARELADGVDLLVCESTYLETEAELAGRFMHMTAAQAGQLAADAGARRLALTHFSARYGDVAVMAEEAGRFHDDVVALVDLERVSVPPRVS